MAEFDETQTKVLNSPPNLIISGCPGSGKTILAFSLANKLGAEHPNKKILVLVLTRALRAYIIAHIVPINAPNIKVLHTKEWEREKYPPFDIIIVDEVVDFSKEDLNDRIIPKAKDGVYLFGDTKQKLYEGNFEGEETLTMENLVTETKFPHIRLKGNYRISNETIAFLGKKVENVKIPLKGNSNIKPHFHSFETEEEETQWLIDYVKYNRGEDIGILFWKNSGQPSIEDFWRRFDEQNISIGYKQKFDDHLSFQKEKNANILTVHSSKGLEFDTVIMPFYHQENGVFDFNPNLFYVALTRAKRKLIISYHGYISQDWVQFEKAPEVFEGELKEDPNLKQRRLLVEEIFRLKEEIEKLRSKSQRR